MEILNPAWKKQQKRRLAILIGSAISLQAVTAQTTGVNLFSEVVEALEEDNSNSNSIKKPEIQQINEIGLRMKNDITPYEKVDPDWAIKVAQEKGSSVYLGEAISVEDAMRYNYIAGFRGRDLIIKTAIDGKESGYHPGAVGDVNWNLSGDRSVGTAQIYCQPNGNIKCEGIRDWRANFDPQTNANNSFALYMMAINGPNHDNGLSGDGRFAPWRNNPNAVRENIPRAEQAYASLTEAYGNLN